MKNGIYSNGEFNQLRSRINKEIIRRSTYRWWDPLSSPKVGNDKSFPINIPEQNFVVDDETYTINTPSVNSIEPTRNIRYPLHGDNPYRGTNDELYRFLTTTRFHVANNDLLITYAVEPTVQYPFDAEIIDNELIITHPIDASVSYEIVGNEIILNIADISSSGVADINSSAARFDVDEMRNFTVGLSKINDINLFYGRDEKAWTAFRDPSGIEELLTTAEQDKLHELIEFTWDVDIDTDGNLIVFYSGDVAPNVWINDEGELVISYTEGDKYERISTVRFHVEDGQLFVDDEDNVFYIRYDPHNETNELDRRVNYENISTLRFHIDEGALMMDHTWHFVFPFQFDVSVINEELVVECSDYINPVFDVINGELIITYDDGGTPTRLVEQDGYMAMPSGEYEGEELYTYEGLGPGNFFDDYGAPRGNGHFRTYNRAITPVTRRDLINPDDDRTPRTKVITHGGVKASEYGQNPRNPHIGEAYSSVPVYRGVPGACQAQCTGLCYTTCDDQCSESCTVSCFSRCGNGCTSSCGNACTGCSTLCYSSCKTKCENTTGYACVKAGAKTVKITSVGGKNGVPASNNIEGTSYSCTGCSYSCQFYPNKKTECWDAACMGKCFNTCESSCSDSCTGGCIDNSNENTGDYKVGKGRGCSAGCTINCIGTCESTCQGQCVETCYHACKQSCTDNCEWTCETNCGSGCANGCKNGCTGCDTSCEGNCLGNSTSRQCTGCSSSGGCTSTCQNDCNGNCMNAGCKAMCGTGPAQACDFNCRMNCSSTSCTSMCSDQCTDQCSSCVNTCGFACGMCSSMCSAGCEGECEVTCVANCEHSCESNCVQSCSDVCGGCSNLCYSCTGMCIGVCSLKCENGCSSCDTMCGWWCDTRCSQACFGNCDTTCISNCSNTCSTHATADTTNTSGPEYGPTAEGYHTPNPSNRLEEQESFNLHLGDL